MNELTTDQKWEVVKEYYLQQRVKFKHRPKDSDIEMLFEKMHQLARDLKRHQETPRPTVRLIRVV